MALSILNKYVWLVDTICRAQRISFKEINQRWLDNELSEGVEMSRRTFHKWRIDIEEIFGLVIENENRGEYRYYILNEDELRKGDLRSWLINTISVSNLLANSQSIKDRILLEEIPSGRQYLSVILEAMRENRALYITYQSYWKDEANSFTVEPYCVKLFKQRWYLVARSPYYDKVMIYGVDRIQELTKLPDETFRMPEDFSPEAFFYGCYGAIADDGTELEKVELQVSAGQANYFRSLPLHKTQEETFRSDDYSIFQYELRPTFDFQQEILAHGSDVEVLIPVWFRQQVADRVAEMNNKYNTDKDG